MKLFLFDIDGTLIRGKLNRPFGRIEFALSTVFKRPISVPGFERYFGWIDRQILWDIAKSHGITKKQFDANFAHIGSAMHTYVRRKSKGITLYEAIPEAKQLALLLENNPNARVGVLTGNLRRIARWKLTYTKLHKHFPFGLYGDSAPNRIALARQIFSASKKHFGEEFKPEDITIIGDTIHDIRWGKAFGAKTIAVTTGGFSEKLLQAENADIVVPSLLHPQVFSFLGIVQTTL